MEQTSLQDQRIPSGASERIPEYPALAPNVELSGEMQESGFESRQWLIQRDGQFIQISELLYRTAEYADGKRTLAEIAEAVTNATEWAVTADHVRHLIRTKLMPLGLIALGEHAAPFRPAVQLSSPLGFTMRAKVFGPRMIDPITKVLQYLFAPPILIPMLVLIVAAHVWLYAQHGIGNAIRDVLLTPGLLLAVLAVYTAGGIIHELGHAAALRYGGGKVRGMGVGLYIIYPAFYTDTSDSYRLGRWARVRTDLGGFYFHLLFALAIMWLYLVTGQEFLLAVVLLINIDILFQCIPFFRFDGYWMLNDLTGIPDFFSQMAPFLRSLVPGIKGDKLPPLKPWVKRVFIGYMLLTVPLLMLMLFLFVTRAPQIVATFWNSVRNQAGAFTNAQQAGDGLTMIASIAQMLILALPLLGIGYMLYRLAWRPIKALWEKQLPVYRLGAALYTLGVAALIAFLWVPQLSLALVGPPEPEGVQSFEISERAHVQEPVSYEHAPPVAGSHAPIWQNCGFYDRPVANENAVHSMEHGAVWITYHSALDEAQLEVLRNLVQAQTHVLVSPYPELSTPVVASAWGRQLPLESVEDPRLEQFVNAFQLGSQAPERGAPCSGGVGEPQ